MTDGASARTTPPPDRGGFPLIASLSWDVTCEHQNNVLPFNSCLAGSDVASHERGERPPTIGGGPRLLWHPGSTTTLLVVLHWE